MLKGLCAVVLVAGLASEVQACQVIEGASARETELAKKVCDSIPDWEDIVSVKVDGVGLFYITISEQLYRAFRADKVGAEGIAFKMLKAFQGLGIERPKIFYRWSGKQVAEAGYTVLGNEPYLEMSD